MQAIKMITSEEGLGLSPKRITLSTAGVAKMIKKLAEDKVKFNLALSLHAANDEKRSKIMPINDSNNLKIIKEALIEFFNKTKNPITFEYILLKNFNDSLEDAKQLIKLVKSVPSKVNLIEYNPIDQTKFEGSEGLTIEKFSTFLKENKITVNIRKSRGKDIDAACGQLANKDKTAMQAL
jgi:23S rRNA (adenine2503-C2)-methyltransferase